MKKPVPDRAWALQLNFEGMRLFTALDELPAPFAEILREVAAWAAQVTSFLKALVQPSELEVANLALRTLKDVLGAGQDETFQSALRRPMKTIINELHSLATSAALFVRQPDDGSFAAFLEAALHVDAQLALGDVLSPLEVARKANLPLPVAYRCLLRLGEGGLGYLVDEQAGFRIHREQVEPQLARLPAPSQPQVGTEVRSQEALGRRSALIATALPLEAEAVLAHLTEVEEVHREGTVYDRGDFGADWLVVIVRTGPGNANAACETERAVQHFRPEVAMFVGVAGGRKDVGHGDVVVATKVYGYESGTEDAFGFRPRPDVAEPTYAIFKCAEKEATKQGWSERRRGMASACERVFVKPIASGEKLIRSADSQIAHLLGENYGDAVAVEMEGHGFLRACKAHQGLEALVVRGISDLLDDKTAADKANWQQQAAGNAAAFAFEVLARFGGVSTAKASRTRAEDDEDPGTWTPEPSGELHPIEAPPFGEWVELAPVAQLVSRRGHQVEPVAWQFHAAIAASMPPTKSELEAAVMASIVRYDLRRYGRTGRWPRPLFLGTRKARAAALLWTFAYAGDHRDEAGDEQVLIDRSGTIAYQRDSFSEGDDLAVDLGVMASDCWKFLLFAARVAGEFGHSSELAMQVGLRTPTAHAIVGAHFGGGIAAEHGGTASLRTRAVAGSVRFAPSDLLADMDALAAATKRLLDQVANEFEPDFRPLGPQPPPLVAIDLQSLRLVIRAEQPGR